MSRFLTCLAATLLSSMLLAAPVLAAESVPDGVMSPAEVVALGADEDGARITVRGEAIGDILKAGKGGAWLNILGDGTVIGLWSEDEDGFEHVGTLGDYHNRGAIVEVRGTYNAACEQHGGDRDVHADVITVIAPSEPIERPVQLWKLALGLTLIAAAGLIWLQRRRHTALTDL